LPRAGASEIRELDLVGVAHDHEGYVAVAVEEHSELPPHLLGELAQGPGELGSDHLLPGHAPAIEVLDASQLAGLESGQVSVDGFDGSLLSRPI
jgi:hypothetical protein